MTASLFTEDPAVAGAMARCLLARTLDPKRRVTDRHPRACGWCDYPTEELRAGVEAFNEWAGFDDRSGSSRRHPTRAFNDLHREEQDALITAAQVLVDVEVQGREAGAPATAADKPGADGDATPSGQVATPPGPPSEEEPSWLG